MRGYWNLWNNFPDQGHCGSCWAVVPATILTDRFCVAKAKTLRNAIEKFRAKIGKIMERGNCIDWKLIFDEFLQREWGNLEWIFGLKMPGKEEKKLEKIKKYWFELLIGEWVERKKEKCGSILEKLLIFRKWVLEEMDCKNEGKIIGENEMRELVRIWCGKVGRENHGEGKLLEDLNKFLDSDENNRKKLEKIGEGGMGEEMARQLKEQIFMVILGKH